MLKHRGFPGRLPGTDFQFTIRRPNPKGVTPLKRLERLETADPRIGGPIRALYARFLNIFGISLLSGEIWMQGGSIGCLSAK